MRYLPPWLQNAYTHSYNDKDYYAIKVWFGLIVFDTSNTIHNILLLKRLIQCPLSFSIYLGFKKIINFEFRSYDNTLIMTPSLLQNISLCHSLHGLTITTMCNTTMKLFPPTTLWKIVNGELIETLNILPPLTNYCVLIATFNLIFRILFHWV